MKPYVELAQKYGYDVEFAEPNWGQIKSSDGRWNVDELIRNQNRGNRAEEGKVIPDEVVRQMAEEYEYDPRIEDILKSERPKKELESAEPLPR
jgi:hypothetical protein